MKRFLLGLLLALAIFPARAEEIKGVFALAGQTAKVEATLLATPQKDGTGLDIVFTRLDQALPLKNFDVELTKQLHLIAIRSDFGDFQHEHVTHIDADGHFRLVMPLGPGLYHLYADVTPSGLGQQVVRFDLQVGGLKVKAPDLTPTGLEASSGPYTVRFDSLAPVAGNEAMVTLHILKNGQPAPDVQPFLGVPAHAVFIDTDDLSYLHAHPMALKTTAPAGLAQGAVNPDFMLHFTPHKAGVYKLWLQFEGGGALQVVPFVFRVAPAP